MVAIVIGIILVQSKQPTGPIGTEIPQSLYTSLSSVSTTTLNTVGTGGTSALTTVSGSPLTSNGLPEFLYVGADYCPFCAAERWSIIVALSKFGTFNSLTYMLSAPAPETYPDTSTFSFHGSTYTSPYVAFIGVEIQDRFRNTLDTLTAAQTSLMGKYDSSGGIPFVDIYNKYTYSTSQYSPSVLSGLNWTQIGSQLDDPNSIVAKNIDGAANNLVTAICSVDGGQPSSVCSQTYAHQFLTTPSQGQLLDPLFSPIAQDKLEPPVPGNPSRARQISQAWEKAQRPPPPGSEVP